MNQLEANDLLLFARVVEAGSLSRAAEALGIPTSTVSRRITALEMQIGERLIQRTTRRLIVTEIGHAVLDHARRVVEGVDAAAAIADHRNVKPGGRLRVTMVPDHMLLSSFIAEFSAAYPSITLELDLSMRMVDLVGENYDVAIRTSPLRDDALAARKILDLHAALFASPAYLAEHGTPREPDDLDRHFAVYGQRGGELLPWRLVNGDKHWEGLGTKRIGANSPDMLVRLAIHGAGIAMCVLRAVEPHVRLGAARPRPSAMAASADSSVCRIPAAKAHARAHPGLHRRARRSLQVSARRSREGETEARNRGGRLSGSPRIGAWCVLKNP